MLFGFGHKREEATESVQLLQSAAPNQTAIMDRDIRAGITHILTSIFRDIDRLDHHQGLKKGSSEYVDRVFQHLAQDAERYPPHASIENRSDERGQSGFSYKIRFNIGEIFPFEQMIPILYDFLKSRRDITHNLSVEDDSCGHEPFERAGIGGSVQVRGWLVHRVAFFDLGDNIMREQEFLSSPFCFFVGRSPSQFFAVGIHIKFVACSIRRTV